MGDISKFPPVDADQLKGYEVQLPTTSEDGQVIYWDDTAQEWKLKAAGGGSANDVWFDVTGTYASADTFTFSGDVADSDMIVGALFTCLSSGDARRVGYVKSASHTGGTVTVTVTVAATPIFRLWSQACASTVSTPGCGPKTRRWS